MTIEELQAAFGRRAAEQNHRNTGKHLATNQRSPTDEHVFRTERGRTARREVNGRCSSVRNCGHQDVQAASCVGNIRCRDGSCNRVRSSDRGNRHDVADT